MNRSNAETNAAEVRDARGEWRPAYPCAYAPLFTFPPQVTRLLKWLFGWPGFLWPVHALHVGLAVVTWRWLQPPLDACVTLRPGWILAMFLRNAVLMWAVYGGLHLVLYTLRWHGTARKYRLEGPETGARRFLFRSQVYDNVFRSFVVGCPFWTAYEVLYVWLAANGRVPLLAWSRHPWAFAAWFLVIPLWRELHFYVIHRALHWRPLFRTVHRVHHYNYNPGPWSGLAMHWVELLVYFSVVLVHWVLASHPIHLFYNAQLTALTPAYGHIGFEGPLFGGKLPIGSYFHYLHHRYVTCNYGEATIPLDKWFGTFYDGTGPYRRR